MRYVALACFGVVLMISALAGAALAGESIYGFGGGGPALGLFMPDLAEVNAFVEAAGFAPFNGNLLLVGGGGRGGLIPGPALGGAGWGAWIESRSGNLHAEYGIGAGGFDLGYAAGGDERSVLTVGGLLGGGGAGLILIEDPLQTPLDRASKGIVVEPAQRKVEGFFAFAAPYVDIQIQLLDWMGIGLRAGYLWVPIELIWQDDGLPDMPRLTTPGPFVQLSFVFGGIGTIDP